ncbi:MAG: hypothetical protein V2A59_03290 [Candidatus Omnitrophota bacterium]
MHKKHKGYLILVLALVILFSGSRLCLGEAAKVPQEFQDLYSELDEELNRVDSFFNLKDNSSNFPVLFGVQLLSADVRRSDKLLEPGEYKGMLMQLERLKGLGVQLVTISIGFPGLYQPFYKRKKDYEAYLDFYKRLSNEIHSRGMKLIIETQPLAAKLGVGEDSPDTLKFLQGLKFKEYIKARSAALIKIAKELQPDYLSIISEPDTEAMLSAQPLDDLNNSSLLVNYVVAVLRKSRIKGIKLGAGVGLWHPRYRAFVLSFAQCRRLDFIDLHVYPINLGLLGRVEESADIAIKHHKRIGISEAWLYKCRTRELGKGNNSAELFSRDAFAFWEPLDEKFLKVITALTRINRFDFFSLFWPNVRSVNLTNTYAQLIKEGQQVNK